MSTRKMPLMQCGCVAQGLMGDKPVCVVHALIIPEAMLEATEQPDLTGRKASCGLNCKKIVDSSFDLAFFEYRPDKETDLYYCGCRGWD